MTTTTTTTDTTATTNVFGDGGASAVVTPSVDDIVISLPPEDHLSTAIDEISGPLTAQVFELCGTDLFPETLQSSEVTSNSNCYLDENPSYTTNLSFPSDVNEKYSTEPLDPNKVQDDPKENLNASTTTSGSTTTTTPGIVTNTNTNANTLSVIFDSQDELDNDISASIDFSTSPPFSGAPYLTITHQDQLDFSSVEPQVQLADIASGLPASQYPTNSLAPIMAPTLTSSYEDDCLQMMPPFLGLNSSTSSSYSLLDPPMGSFLPLPPNTSPLVAGSSGVFPGNILVGHELQPKESEYHNDNSGIFCPDQLQRAYNSSDIQNLSNNNQQLVNGSVSSPLTTEISNLEDSTFKTGKLSVEQRKEKISRYLKKRNERNFSKKIKYACRKTLADSRPRVRGRFAKNDDFGDTHRNINGHPEDEEYDEVSVKEEDDFVVPSDMFAHIGGVNSFKYAYSIPSWM